MIKDQTPPGLKLRHTLRGYTKAIAWSPDGQMIASPSKDKTIRIWDAVSGKVLKVLKGHESWVFSVAWSPDGQMLASGSSDKTIRIWNSETGKVLKVLEDETTVYSVAWSPDGQMLASGSEDETIRLWNAKTGKVLKILKGHSDTINSVAWSPDGEKLVSGSDDRTVCLWNIETGKVFRTLTGHIGYIMDAAWSLDGCTFASASNDSTIRLWNSETGQLMHLLEGHTDSVTKVSYSANARILASKSMDGTVLLWGTKTWLALAKLLEPSGSFYAGLAFHPTAPVLATLGEDDRVIRIWDLDYSILLGEEQKSLSDHYRNAKVVLLGDTGVGKSGLGLVLSGQEFQLTESTHGRHVWMFEEKEVQIEKWLTETRETLLWDMAGQPGYRLVHQLHLDEVAVALLVFDARNETEPLAGVRHWDRALRQALKRQGDSAIPLKKFLVVARTDRGGISISKERLERLKREMAFDGYFETSAKEGWQVKELISAICEAIDWDVLPKVTSTKLFHTIKEFILEEKEAARLLCTVDELFRAFCRAHSDIKDDDLKSKFDTCLSRLQNRDLIRSLSFGDYVLLQPEILDSYASAMINAAKSEPDGLGSLSEEVALICQFAMPTDARIPDKKQEEVILIPTVKELVDYDLALREPSDEGTYLVFPSQFVRDWPEAPDPAGKSVLITFEGPVQNVYATLAVRLAHSGLFSTERAEMWRNAVKYEAIAGGVCGIYLREFSEGEGELTLFYSPEANPQTRFEFEEYVITHLKRRSLDEALKLVRLFVCKGCGTTVPESYAAGRVRRGLDWIECGACGKKVSLTDPKEDMAKIYPSRVAEMDAAADAARNLNSAAMTLRGKIKSNDFDVFLCHNSEDKAAVKKIGEELKKYGILPWLDEWNLQPGLPWQDALEDQIKLIKSVAVFIGPKEMGPWQNQEQKAFLRQFVERECPVIPVILPGCSEKPELPLFLKAFTWVDFRNDDPDPLKRLIWGITGKRDSYFTQYRAI